VHHNFLKYNNTFIIQQNSVPRKIQSTAKSTQKSIPKNAVGFDEMCEGESFVSGRRTAKYGDPTKIS